MFAHTVLHTAVRLGTKIHHGAEKVSTAFRNPDGGRSGDAIWNGVVISENMYRTLTSAFRYAVRYHSIIVQFDLHQLLRLLYICATRSLDQFLQPIAATVAATRRRRIFCIKGIKCIAAHNCNCCCNSCYRTEQLHRTSIHPRRIGLTINH